jgi:DUF438 domain-containing protein
MKPRKFNMDKADAKRIANQIPIYPVFEKDQMGNKNPKIRKVHVSGAVAKTMYATDKDGNEFKPGNYYSQDMYEKPNHVKKLLKIAKEQGDAGIREYIEKCGVEYKTWIKWKEDNEQTKELQDLEKTLYVQ